MQIMEYEERLISMKAESDALRSKQMLGVQNSFVTNPSVLVPSPSFMSDGNT